MVVLSLSIQARASCLKASFLLGARCSARNGGRRHRSSNCSKDNGRSNQAKGLASVVALPGRSTYGGRIRVRYLRVILFHRSTKVHFRDLARRGGDPYRVLFLRRVDSARFIFPQAKHNVRSQDQYRRSHFSFVVRFFRAPYARVFHVVSQRFNCHVRDPRQGKQVRAKGSIRSIGRTFASFRVFVMRFASMVFQFVREDLNNCLTGRQQARANLARFRRNLTRDRILHCRYASASATFTVAL